MKVTAPAQADARGYADWILRRSHFSEPAQRWLNGLEDQIKTLSEMPRRYPVIAEQAQFAIELREFLYFSHRVIFHVKDASKTVHILRVYTAAHDALRVEDLLDGTESSD